MTNGQASFGWPYHVDMSKYNAQFDSMFKLFVKFLGLFTADYSLIQNIYTFAIPLFNVVVCYLVLRNIKFRIWLAGLASILFGFCPYVQGRLTGHFALASIECIPLAFLLCLWLYEDDSFARIGKGWFKYRRNYISIFFAWMIANNGMIYYPFFTCFILVVVGICLWARSGKIKDVLPAVTVIGQIMGWLIIGFIPTVIGIFNGAGNAATNGAGRNAFRATVYGLSIKSMILSPRGYGISAIRAQYPELMVINNENARAYIGIVAIIGLLGLLLFLFIDRTKEQTQCAKRIKFLSKITIAMLLLAVADGMGVLVAIVFPYLSCYNRISPFIVFVSILTVGLVAENWCSKLSADKIKKNCLVVFTVLLFVYSIWEQRSVYCYFTSDLTARNKVVMESDEKFFAQLQDSAGTESMVFQLPYMRAFENGPVNEIPDYDHFKGYLFTKDIKWSFGATNGSENDVWYSETSRLSAGNMVKELKEKGFAGIYLNLNGYDEETGNLLKEQLCIAADCQELIVHNSGKIVYISLENYIPKPAVYSWMIPFYKSMGQELAPEEALDLSERFVNGDSEVYKEIYSLLEKKGLANADYVHVLYTQFLGRGESELENKNWTDQLDNGMSRYDIFLTVIESDEFQTKFDLKN